MYRIDGPDTTPALPIQQAPGPPGFFWDGNSATGRLSTMVTPDWLNMVQEEIIAVIDWAGIPLAKGTLTQLRDALIRMGRPVLAPDIGTQNAVHLSLPNGPALEKGLRLAFSAAFGNNGPTTLDYNGTGAAPLRAAGGQVEGFELFAGWLYTVIFDGGSWNLISQGAGSVSTMAAQKASHAIPLSQFPALFDGRFPSAFNNAFTPAWDARFATQFPPAFENGWTNHFDPYFADRFATQFPPNFDSRFAAEFPQAFKDQWNAWLRPTQFNSGVGTGSDLNIVSAWQQLPNGWYLQFGLSHLAYGPGQIFGFPLAFPHGCVNMVVSDWGSSWGRPQDQPRPTNIGYEVPANYYWIGRGTFTGPGSAPPFWASDVNPITIAWWAIGN